MNHSRLDQLLTYYQEHPDDPFNIYALATEYKSFDPLKARYYFEILLRDHENYVATYYHLGHLYIDLGEANKAREIFEKGIEIAAKNKDTLALRELKNAYDEFTLDY